MNRKIKAALVSQGIKQKDIANELGILVATVSGVLNGHHSSRRIKAYVNERLKKPPGWGWDKKAA